MSNFAIAEQDAAAGRSSGAGQHFDQLALAVAFHAGDPEDLTLVQLERNAMQCGDAPVRDGGQVFDAQRDRSRLCRLLIHAQQHVAADHQAGDLSFGRVTRLQVANDLATPHHGNAIGDLEDFLQLM